MSEAIDYHKNLITEVSGEKIFSPDPKDSDNTNARIWSQACLLLAERLNLQVYTAFIKPLSLKAFDSSVDLSSVDLSSVNLSCTNLPRATVCAPSKFLCSHVEANYAQKIAQALSDVLVVDSISVRFSYVESELSSVQTQKSSLPYVVVKRFKQVQENYSKNESAAPQALKFGSKPNPRYTFANFIVGRSNELAQTAALKAAQEPGKNYSPLFIYGSVGLGKTHLLHAIGNAVLEKTPSARVIYMSSETFTNELISALRFGKMDEFKTELRTADVLLIDDIQFIAGKDRTQEEFFHTFNCLHELKRQIVLTCDRQASEIPGLEDRLKTRFCWGLSADIHAPDFETRVEILKKKAAEDSRDVAQDVFQLIAQTVSSNVRELEGALTRIFATASLQNAPINLALAEAALKPMLAPRQVKVSVALIKSAICEIFSLKQSELVSKKRSKNINFPRQIAMFLCRKHTTSSYPEIGALFGGRDHSSVIHSATVVANKIAGEDVELMKIISKVEEKLGLRG